ncbi:MAG: o-succinylbenzoate--CoA ligase, partial [Firmicutes bacterium]|nr:o-succinylbenzoate--CoA ligase [Bacillota bacterium]
QHSLTPPWIELERVQSLMYTSGTTGKPKGAMITYGNHFYGATASAFGLGLDKKDVWFTAMPLFHVGGQAVLMRSLLYGTTALIHDRFDPVAVLDALEEHGVTLLSVVSVMLADLLRERGQTPWPTSVRCILLGGGPAPEPLLARAAAVGLAVSQSYGLTESNSQAVTLLPQDAFRKLGSAGKPLLCTALRIVHDGVEQPAMEPGEIVLRGPTLVSSYWRREEATAAAFKDGWLHTGDLGYLDGDGYLYVLDRRSDLIVSGGENVYPAELEAVLLEHEDVLEAGVTGLPDERFGQRPVAVVRLREGAQVSSEQLIGFCRGKLAGYKTPTHIAFASSLPRNAAGKLLRRELGAWF